MREEGGGEGGREGGEGGVDWGRREEGAGATAAAAVDTVREAEGRNPSRHRRHPSLLPSLPPSLQPLD